MPKETVDVSLHMRTEGAAKVASDTQDIGQKSTQALSKVDREVAKLEQTFKKLADRQLELSGLMDDMSDKGSDAYKGLQKDMAAVQREAAGVERTLQNVRRAYRDTDEERRKAEQKRKREEEQQWRRERRRGSFFQGLLQGAIPSAQYLKRGPGMVRQAMGAAIGGRLRMGLGGIARTPWAGAQGLAQAITALPGGEAIAAPLMQSMGYAQQALQFRQQRQQMMPFLQMREWAPGRTMVGESAVQQRARLTKSIQAEMAKEPPVTYGRAPVTDIFYGEGRTVVGEVWKKFKAATGGGREDFGVMERRRAREVAAAGGEEAFRAKALEKRVQQDIESEGVSRQRRATLQDIVRIQGRKFGYALPEAMQLMGGVTQAGGGVGRELVTQQLGVAGMAAQRLYGLGPEVTGAFLQAGRRGGVVGAEGRGGAAYVEAIAGGMRMGLEGSELTNWMSQMAQDIRSWQQTGIPINTGSVNALGASMAKWGLGGVRGGAVARGITARARELTTRGPQGAEELILLQELGGLQGTGVQAFEEAQLRMEEGGFGPEDVRRVMTRFMGAGGGAAGGRQVFRRAMKRFGVQIGVAETRLLEKQITGQELTPEENAKIKAIDEQIAQVAGGAPESVGAMGRRAREKIDPALKRQAQQTDQQLAVGDKMLPIMQNLEDSTRNVATGFTELAAGPLKEFSGSIKNLSERVPELARRFEAMSKGDYAAAIGPLVPYAPGESQ